MRLCLIAAALALTACGSKSGGSADAKQPNPANTLAPAQFHEKAAGGDQIFNDMKGVPASFGAGKAKMLMSLLSAAPVPQAASEFTVDVNSSACHKSGAPTADEFGHDGVTSQVYACKVPVSGKPTDCDVTVSTDATGHETSRSIACAYTETPAAPATGGTSNGSQESQQAAAYLPRADQVTDCASAFDLFQSLFSQAQADYDQLTSALKDAAQSDKGFALTAATPAADESVAYELKPQDANSGITFTGRIAGGGTDTSLTMKESMRMTTDLSSMQMPDGMPAGLDLGQTKMALDNGVQLDLAARKVVSTVNMTVSETANGKTETQAVRGSIEVSDGADKYVHQALTVALGTDPSQAFATDLTARLVDANTMTIDGTFTGAGKPGSVSYKVTKTAAGTCALGK